MTPEKAALLDGAMLAAELETLFGEPLTEASFVEHVSRWLDDEAAKNRALNLAAQICGVGGAVSGRPPETLERRSVQAAAKDRPLSPGAG